MPSPALHRYNELAKVRQHLQEKYGGGSPEEDTVLDQMDAEWKQMSTEDRDAVRVEAKRTQDVARDNGAPTPVKV